MNQQAAWERFAKTDPYFAVYPFVDSKDRFFADGEKIVSHLMSVAKEMHPAPFTRALDFGCGIGRLAIPISRHCKEMVGVDHAEGMLQEARKNAPGINFTTKTDGTFDLITCLYVFQHIPYQQGMAIVRDLLGKLTDDGVAILHFQYAAKSYPLAFIHFLKRHFGFVNPLLNIVQGKPLSKPRMIMVPYPLNPLMETFRECGVASFRAEYERARDWHGLIFYLRKGHQGSLQD